MNHVGYAILIVLILLLILSPAEILAVAAFAFILPLGKSYTGGAPLTPDQLQIVQNAYISDPANYFDADTIRELCIDGEDKIATIEASGARSTLRSPLTGGLDYLMEDGEITNILADTLHRWRSQGILMSESEFSSADETKYHKQRSLYPDMGADVTRIFGAEYLDGVFTRDNIAELAVPKYRLVVPDLSNITCWITSQNESFNGNNEGLVWRGVSGVLYAEKITGTPSITKLYDEVKSAVNMNRATGSWQRTAEYPRGDRIQSLANSLYNDYGVGIGPNATGDNAILMNDKYYFIDTELKSFALKFTRTPPGRLPIHTI